MTEPFHVQLAHARGWRRQEDAASAVGVVPMTLSRWENGRGVPPSDALDKLCDYYELADADRLRLFAAAGDSVRVVVEKRA